MLRRTYWSAESRLSGEVFENAERETVEHHGRHLPEGLVCGPPLGLRRCGAIRRDAPWFRLRASSSGLLHRGTLPRRPPHSPHDRVRGRHAMGDGTGSNRRSIQDRDGAAQVGRAARRAACPIGCLNRQNSCRGASPFGAQRRPLRKAAIQVFEVVCSARCSHSRATCAFRVDGTGSRSSDS